ncbi:MAG: BspA family leucine-rich repeat surface protein [Candidatus Heimdallarchaeota archaeon]|nr:BspA family leucine-rich repeat surface protein [Candidatus Heimdallarchaeota archaeon]
MKLRYLLINIMIVFFLLPIFPVNEITDDSEKIAEEFDTSDYKIRSSKSSYYSTSSKIVSSKSLPPLHNNLIRLTDENTFISKWNTSKTSDGSSNATQIKLPLIISGNYNFQVNWGDSSTDTITSYNQEEVTHNYASEGVYDITIDGTIAGWQFGNSFDKLKILEISQWGSFKFGNSGSYFHGASNLNLTATDAPDLSGTLTLYQAFRWCDNLGSTGSMNSWNTSKITTMNYAFQSANTFNQSIANWDMSNVISMVGMFGQAYDFNQPIGNWNVSKVTEMYSVFQGAISFNQSLANWDISSATSLYAMFASASSFNQDLSSWNLTSATLTHYMFADAIAFNQPVSGWDVSRVTNMNSMFHNAQAFNQPLNSWDTSNVTSMQEMFWDASSFNQSLDGWDVSKVTNMYRMFRGATPFNQDLSNWNISSVTNMDFMLFGIVPQTYYDEMLISWSSLNLQDEVTFDGGNSKYTIDASDNRQYIIDTYNWTIKDTGLIPPSATERTFLSKWNTSSISVGSSNSSQIQLPLEENGNYHFYVDWGDGSQELITSWNQTESTHNYEVEGEYNISIDGLFEGWIFDNQGDKLKLLEISQWGDLKLGNSGSYFRGAENFQLSAVDPLDLTDTTTFYRAFVLCKKLGDLGFMNMWDVSNISSMAQMFYGATTFNQSISNWDVSQVTDMSYFLFDVHDFNQPLGNWDVSQVTDMSYMFQYNYIFNQPLSDWNVSQVKNMRYMFSHCEYFNQSLDNWDVSSVTNMFGTFHQAFRFNQPLGNWNVSNVTSMFAMFHSTYNFDQPLGNWDISKVTSLEDIFKNTELSIENYNNLLLGWSQLNLKSNLTFTAGSSRFGYIAKEARDILTETFGWVITDSGLDNRFISRWDTRNLSDGSSNSNQITLPLEDIGTYDFTVDWGDGTSDTISSWDQVEVTHTYSTEGIYTIMIEGSISGWRFENTGDRLKLLEISQWGVLNLGNSGSYFWGTSNFELTAIDPLDLTGTTTLIQAFAGCSSLGDQGYIDHWNTSEITSMNALFGSAVTFNMSIGDWDVSKVTDMYQLFHLAIAFNQPIGEWNVSSVTSMDGIFWDARAFNQPLDDWDISHVTTLRIAFNDAEVFNQPIGSWNTSQVTDMYKMFGSAPKFNQPIGNWDVSRVTVMQRMFSGAVTFNQDLSGWNTSQVQDMMNMFTSAYVFNQDLSGWDVSEVRSMDSMFRQAFDFDQDLSSWNISNVLDMDLMFAETGISSVYYSNMLSSWSQLNLQQDINFDAGDSSYQYWAIEYRDILTNTFNWVITDAGRDFRFISRWDTRLTSDGSSTSNQITLPLESIGSYDFTVDWGDGNSDTITSWDQIQVTHTYATEGIYTIIIDGELNGWRFNNGGDKLKLLEISQWGSMQLGNSASFFLGSSNFVLTAIDPLNLTGTTTLYQAFTGCSSLGDQGFIDHWDTSKITSMTQLFSNALSFNMSIGNWNVSSVETMYLMFNHADAFNQPIGNWDVSSVSNMNNMFWSAAYFNQDINSWNVSQVTTMQTMFKGAIRFNQPLDNWDVSKVTDMDKMFSYTPNFNHPIGTWDVSSVTSMAEMFAGASVFNQDLSQWNTSQVNNMFAMFSTAYAFNQDISSWDVSSVVNMNSMFYQASNFDQDLSSWNISSVTDMTDIFSGISLLTQYYDLMLEEWSKLSLQYNVSFNAGLSNHTNYEARQFIIDTFNWTITDAWYLAVASAPLDVVTDLLGDHANITWSAPEYLGSPGLTEYHIYRRVELESQFILIGISFSLSYLDYNITHGYMYYYKVVAINDHGSGEQSAEGLLDLVDPGIDVLSDLTAELGADIDFSWNITDSNPHTYTIYLNGSIVDSGNYSSEVISYNLSPFDLGTYNITIIANDTFGNIEFVQRMITVVDTTSPIVSSPVNLQLEQEDDNAVILTWLATDLKAQNVSFYIDGNKINETSWISNQNISFSITQFFNLGQYNFSVLVTDTSGNAVLDTVIVTIIDTSPPQITSPEDLSFESGTTGNTITWQGNERNPYYYRIYLNGTQIAGLEWDGADVSLQLDNFLPHGYNFTIILYDSSGNTVSDTVMVSIIDSTAPEMDEEEILENNPNVQAGGIMVVYIEDENEIVRLEYSWNGGDLQFGRSLNSSLILTAKDRYYFELDVPEGISGNNALQLRAYDSSGNFQLLTMTVGIALESSSDDPTVDLEGIGTYLLIAFASLLTVLGLFLMIKRLRKDTEESDEAEEILTSGKIIPEVFISFSSKDKKLAEEVFRTIDKKYRVWISTQSIDAGENYANQIIDAIDSSKVFVLLISKHSIQSRHVETELERGFSKRKEIIPVMLEEITIPRSWEYYLSTSQWKRAHEKPKKEWIAEILSSIHQKLGKSVDEEIDELMDRYDQSDKKI